MKQASRITLAERFFILVQVDTVGADIRKIVGAALEIDRCMLAGYESVRIGQYPVIFQGASDDRLRRFPCGHLRFQVAAAFLLSESGLTGIVNVFPVVATDIAACNTLAAAY